MACHRSGDQLHGAASPGIEFHRNNAQQPAEPSFHHNTTDRNAAWLLAVGRRCHPAPPTPYCDPRTLLQCSKVLPSIESKHGRADFDPHGRPATPLSNRPRAGPPHGSRHCRPRPTPKGTAIGIVTQHACAELHYCGHGSVHSPSSPMTRHLRHDCTVLHAQ